METWRIQYQITKKLRRNYISKILKNDTGTLVFRKQLINIYLSEQNYQKAKLWIVNSLKLYEQVAWFRHNLSILNIKQGELYDGYLNAKCAVKLEPNKILYRTNLIKIFYLLGLHSQVVSEYKKIPEIMGPAGPIQKVIQSAISSNALELATILNNEHKNTDETEYLISLSRILVRQFEFKKAQQKLSEAIHINKSVDLICELIFNFPDFSLHQSSKDLLERVVENNPENSDLLFAYAQCLRNDGHINESFKFFKLANMTVKARIKRSVREFKREFNSLEKSIFNKNKPDFDLCTNFTPIFVVGLPRSGTTIVEQILARNPKIIALGEVPYATISASNLPYSSRAIKIFRERYLDFLGANEGFYIDKMPINFEYLPWIIEGLPEAKIIMTERSLEKQIFAIFSRRFNTANYLCKS